MTDAPYDNQMLRRYLLGTASESEVARLDELSLTDDDCALALAAAENDLVDAYANDGLPVAEREHFARHYLASPARREKAQFAAELQRFDQRVGASLPAAPDTKPAFWNLAWFRFTPLWQAGLTAAALVLLAACLWLAVENRRLRQAVSREQGALVQREAEWQAREKVVAERERALAIAREQLARPTSTLTPTLTPTPSNAPPGVPALNLISFTLAPPQRGTASLPVLKIPASAQQVAIRLELESATYARYRVVLREAQTQRVLWQSGSLAATKSKTAASVNVRLVASRLAAGRYAFELSGSTADNAEERISSYSFEVRQP